MNTHSKQIIILLLVAILILSTLSLTGCKKKTESARKEEAVTEVIEQQRCPVMDGAINKELYTEYKGKKVYFCCPGCEKMFEKEPDKYLSKLPQFRN
jgi:YHS domain-containing protein